MNCLKSFRSRPCLFGAYSLIQKKYIDGSNSSQRHYSIGIGIGSEDSFQPKDIEIPVPWGVISGKIWGNEEAKEPVLCIHGWMDNCATFDRIIPYLKGLKDHYFIAIDMPGHGRSSHFPIGQLYQVTDFVICLKRIKKHFGWKKFSVIGHSFGAICGFLYASTTKDINKLVAIDALTPIVIPSSHTMSMVPVLIDTMLALEEKHSIRTPPLFTPEDMIKRMKKKNVNSVDDKGCSELMTRGAEESESDPGKYFFTHDVRLKYLPVMLFLNLKQVEVLARNFHADLLYFKANKGVHYQSSRVLKRVKNWIRSNPKRANSYFEILVEGNHYIHMNNSGQLAPPIVRFLL